MGLEAVFEKLWIEAQRRGLEINQIKGIIRKLPKVANRGENRCVDSKF